MFVSVTFNFDTYKEASKARTLEVGKKLSENYYSGSSVNTNEAELIALDYVPSSGSFYCTELNTDIGLWDPQVWVRTGFDFDALTSFASSSGHNKIEYIFAQDEEDINPGKYWVAAASASAQKYEIGFDTKYLIPITSTGYNTSATTFYVKNISVSNDGLIPLILEVSRNKSLFRDFMDSNNMGNYMTPTASADLSNNLNGSDSPDVVTKQVAVDNKKGLSFCTLTADNRTNLLTEDPYCERFMVPDVTDKGYPAHLRGTALVYHQALDLSGSLWLRPTDSQWSWGYDAKYVESGSNQWSFKPTGVIGHFSAGTKVYMHDDSLVNIESVNTGSYVKSAYFSGSDVGGIMTPTLLTDDRLLAGLDEPWRDYTIESGSTLDHFTATSSSVETIIEFDFNTWVKVNDLYEISPAGQLFIKSGSAYKFVQSTELTTDYKLISQDKSEIDITAVAVESGSWKTFYGLDLEDQDIYFVSESLFVEVHHTAA